MRGLFTPITKIRRQVFTEVARFAYERDLGDSDFSYFYDSSYRIIPGEQPLYRDSVFKERAIVRERIRLALGLPLRPVDRHHPFTEDMEQANTAGKCLVEPLIKVIPFACEACPTDTFFVTDNCRKCLAHPCTSVCPVKAVTIGKKAAIIDNDKCIKCGRCAKACPYTAIVRYDRPCAAACGAAAIESDELDRAVINQDKCVACGLCIVSCPFAAIADKSEIFQLITAIRKNKHVYVEIAPAFVGQFGPLATPGKIISALKKLGFKDVIEVGLGADIGSLHEAEAFIGQVPDKKPFLGTSCCPSWEELARASQPELSDYISSAHTPMVATAKRIKELDEEAIVAFIGPCIAKKREALEAEVKDYVDFVITFEELMGMFGACDIEWQDLEEEDFKVLASQDGRNYAIAGNVGAAIAACIKQENPAAEIEIENEDTLRDCKKMLLRAKAGQCDGKIIEGMACPGGCVGGPGTLMPIPRAGASVRKFAAESDFVTALDNPAAVTNKI